ncbi:ankyrin-1-like [Trichogramma pretiosum]|uniref:ankyrin-1-like n=1 Tax=Trichogramma pretiosum TaxID=7493 RepID=UPI0006C94952|nr:ankyrin-1-like [Trichogramma pretiosum]
MVQKFVEQGVNVNVTHSKFWGKTPLFMAVYSRNEKVVELLLKHGANPNALGSTCLNKAIIYEDVKIVEIILKYGANLNILDENGRAPLHEASQDRSAEILEMLLKEGANPNIFDKSGKTPLHYLFSIYPTPFTPKYINKVKILLENGADANIFWKNSRFYLGNWHFNFDSTFVEILLLFLKHGATLDKSAEYYLSYIIGWTENEKYLELIELLLQKGANPNTSDFAGNPLLHRVILSRSKEAIEVFLKYGADPNIIDRNGKTPLIRAIASRDYQTASLLLIKGAEPNRPSVHGEIPLQTAIYFHNLECVELLLKNGADPKIQRSDGKSPLLIALEDYNFEIIEVLLKYNVDLNISYQDRKTILENSVMRNHPEIFKRILEVPYPSSTRSDNVSLLLLVVRYRRSIMLKSLLECGFDASVIDDDRKTALHYAAYEGNEKMIEVLIKCCNPNLLDIDGNAPLHLAVDQGHIGVIEALLKNGVDPDVLDGNGRTCLHTICENGLYYKSNRLITWNSRPSIGRSVMKLIHLFVKYNCNVNVKDKKGNTPLFTIFSTYDIVEYNMEMREYQRDAMQILLKHANISEVNLNRQSILHLVVDSCLRVPLSDASENVKDEIGIEMVEILLKSGTNVDAEDIWGQSPLFIAVTHLNYDVVKLLLEYGASVSNICFNKEDFKDVKKLLPRAEISLYFLEIMDILEKEGYKNNLREFEIVKYLFLPTSN